MEDMALHKNNKLTDTGEDSDSSGDSIGLPPVFRVSHYDVTSQRWDQLKHFQVSRALKKHGYTMMKELWQGILGTDFLVTDNDGDPFVVKQMNYRDRKELVTIQNQVKVLKTLKHVYIVSYEDSFEDKNQRHYYAVMEYCAGGDLYKKMQAHKEKGKKEKQVNRIFKEKQIIVWLVQICLALQYLHEKDVLHREIHPQDVFLTEDNNINIGGLLERDDKSAASVMGAQPYVSPEYYLKKSNFKSGIWSLGWLLHDLCMLDVLSNSIKRHCLHALSMTGRPPPISNRYSEDLRELIRQMLSRDPKDRPSPEEILAKPFLRDAVERNCKIPEALQQRLMKSINTFLEACNEHYRDLEILVGEWKTTTDSIESVHYNTTAGTLAGSVIGAAGGIATVGAVLAPFTFGASMIVAGIGIGVGVVGGITGATSSVINIRQQKKLRAKLQQIEQAYKISSEPIFSSLNTYQKIAKKVSKFKDVIRNPTFGGEQCNLGPKIVPYAAQILNLNVLIDVCEIGAQSVKVGRVASSALGVISGLLLILDIVFIVNDAKEIHQMRTGNGDNLSSVCKSINEMRETHNELSKALNVVKETREALEKYVSGMNRSTA